jgi:hypothetical protein
MRRIAGGRGPIAGLRPFLFLVLLPLFTEVRGRGVCSDVRQDKYNWERMRYFGQGMDGIFTA